MEPTKNNRRSRFWPDKPLRAVFSVLAALIVASAAFMQSASGALFRSNPEIAVMLWPGNGLALEQAASTRLLSGITDPADLAESGVAARPIARDALANFALAPKAHAVFAFAETDSDARDRILETASALNRRDLLLQGLALERFVERKEYPQALDTFDRLLRVHPGQKASLYPILDQAFAEPSTLPEFDRILDGSSVWHQNYLEHVLTINQLLPNLARFRSEYRPLDAEFDGALVTRLAVTGEYGTASSFYRRLSGERISENGAGELGWSSEFPPFDWQFADERDLRAQTATSGDGIDIYAKSGSGGVVAERVLDVSRPNLRFLVEHDLELSPEGQLVRLQLRCAAVEAPFFEAPFTTGTARFDVQLGSPPCQTLLLGVYVRAWTGRPAVRGTIRSIRLIPR